MTARRRPCSLLLLLGVLWLPVAVVRAGVPAIAVITSASEPVTVADVESLRDIYLKKTFLDANGQGLVPVNLPADHPLRAAFTRQVLRQTDATMQEYWTQRYFHGVRPPYVLGSQQAVVQFVAETPGAIGYILACRLDPAVRPVLILPLPATRGAALDGLCAP